MLSKVETTPHTTTPHHTTPHHTTPHHTTPHPTPPHHTTPHHTTPHHTTPHHTTPHHTTPLHTTPHYTTTITIIHNRYLRATKWNSNAAWARILATLKWRDEFGVTAGLAKLHLATIKLQSATGKLYTHGQDRYDVICASCCDE